MGGNAWLSIAAAWFGALVSIITIVLAALQYRLTARKTAVRSLRDDIQDLRAENAAVKEELRKEKERALTAERLCRQRVAQLEQQYVTLLVENRELRQKLLLKD